MKCPEGKILSISVPGSGQISADENGVFNVPAVLERALRSFGLLTIGKNIPLSADPGHTHQVSAPTHPADPGHTHQITPPSDQVGQETSPQAPETTKATGDESQTQAAPTPDKKPVGRPKKSE